MANKIISKITNTKDPWFLAEDIPDVYFHFAQIFLSSFANDLEKTVGINYEKVLTIFQGNNLKFYYGEKDSQKFSAHVFKLISKNPRFGEKINVNIELLSQKLKKFCGKINPEYAAKLSNAQLANLFRKLDEMHTKLYAWGWLPNAVDMFHNDFTDHLKRITQKKFPEGKINEALVALSASPRISVIQKEHESFLSLVALKQKDGSLKKFESAVKNHLAKYFYLKHLWLGREGVYNRDYFEKEIGKYVRSGKDASKELRGERNFFAKSLKERKEVLKELKLDQKTARLFAVYAEFAVTKLIRRDAQIYWAYKMSMLFVELSRRLQIPEMSARFMLPDEIDEGLSKGKLESQLIKQLGERSKFCVYFAEKDRDIVITGMEARKIEKKLKKSDFKTNAELFGQTASLGKASGKVKIVNLVSEMAKIKKGDILVSIATNPDIVPVMKKAAAIVTEQGGITSHAAIVSRELRIPCVIGVKNATKILHDGNLVEVDADNGSVKIIQKEKK